MTSYADRLAAEALLGRSEHQPHLLRAAEFQAQRARCTVVALTAVGVDLHGRVPKTWASVVEELARAVGATGFERLDVTPPEAGNHERTPTGRQKRLTYRRFVREHPTGVYVLGNTGHCTALVDGVFVDSEGHGPDTRRVQFAVRLLERPEAHPYLPERPAAATAPRSTPPPREEKPVPRSRLLKDTCELAAAILDGAHDADLDYIQQAVQSRRKSMFRPGLRVQLHGTRNPELDGQFGTVVKVNPKRVTVGLGERDRFGWEREFNVPATMLELV